MFQLNVDGNARHHITLVYQNQKEHFQLPKPFDPNHM